MIIFLYFWTDLIENRGLIYSKEFKLYTQEIVRIRDIFSLLRRVLRRRRTSLCSQTLRLYNHHMYGHTINFFLARLLEGQRPHSTARSPVRTHNICLEQLYGTAGLTGLGKDLSEEKQRGIIHRKGFLLMESRPED